MPLALVHRVRIPGTAGGGPYSAVVMVHGWLGSEKAMSIFDRTLPPGVVSVSPRAPLAVGPDSYGWYERRDDVEGYLAGLAVLREFVASLPDVYPVDSRRVWLVGFSQGAAMGLGLLLSEPTLAAGVAGLAGFVHEAARAWATPGRLAGKPVLILHGEDDETVSLVQAQAAQAVLAEAGAEVTYREYPVGHKLNADGMRDLRQWLATHVGGRP